jgi:HAD superfamily phosphatase (TIGR01668 family)
MGKYLYPDLYLKSILALPLDKLYARNISAFILDLDNTVTEWNCMEVRAEITEWMDTIKNKGFQACIVSNNRRERVEGVAQSLGIPFVHKAGKPFRKAYLIALEVLMCRPEQVAVIGDQVFTDILGGNLMSMFTVLVVPLNRREFLGTRMVTRKVEWMFLPLIRRAVTKGRINSLLND